MAEITAVDSALMAALSLLINRDADLLEIIGLSMQVSLGAVVLASLIGLPLGAALGLLKFPGRALLNVLVNALMGLPPVVAGLCIYMLVSRSGPFGVFDLLYTPAAMMIAQTLLITPVIAAMSRQIVEDLWSEYSEQLRSFGVKPAQAIRTLLWDARFSLITVLMVGFGRAISEVGSVMIVGGNIDHATRVMTTAIATETRMGNLETALGLGIVLLLTSAVLNASMHILKNMSKRSFYS